MHFTIHSDNILTVHETAPAAEPDTITVSTKKDLKKATTDWTIARLVEVWNGFAGVVPLGDLKPAKKFTDRTTARKRGRHAATDGALQPGETGASCCLGYVCRPPEQEDQCEGHNGLTGVGSYAGDHNIDSLASAGPRAHHA